MSNHRQELRSPSDEQMVLIFFLSAAESSVDEARSPLLLPIYERVKNILK